jgi:precorrin-4 methylase
VTGTGALQASNVVVNATGSFTVAAPRVPACLEVKASKQTELTVTSSAQTVLAVVQARGAVNTETSLQTVLTALERQQTVLTIELSCICEEC